MLEDLEMVLSVQMSEEEKLGRSGRAYAVAFGTQLRRDTGAPWAKKAVLPGRVAKGPLNDIIADAQLRLDRSNQPMYSEAAVGPINELAPSNSGEDPDLYLSLMKVNTGTSSVPFVSNFVVAERQSTSGFLPGSIRSLSHRSRFVVRAHVIDMDDSQLIAEASAAGMPRHILRRLAQKTWCAGAILWYFNSRERRFTSLASSGVRGHTRPINVPLDEMRKGHTPVGIIALLRPELSHVVYDETDRSLWYPKDSPKTWGPRDRGLYAGNSWNSCLAIPLLAKGYMVGAISLYGRGPASALSTGWSELDYELLSSCLQGYLRSFEEESRLDHADRLFAEELSRTTTSLAVIGHVHDLAKLARATKSPLRLASDLIEHNLRTDGLEQLRLSMDAADSLVELADQLRRIAKTTVHAPTRLDVGLAIENLRPLLEIQLRNVAGARAELDVSKPTARGLSYTIYADPIKVERTILNLVDNAAFWASESHERPPRVWIRVVPVAEDMGATGVTIEVEDHGPGIDPTVKPHIWERFYTTREDQGTGLGLWLVRKFVSEMQGTVSVDSKPGKTVFRIVIPLAGGG